MKKRINRPKLSKAQFLAFVLVFGAIGGFILLSSKAAGPSVWVSTTGNDTTCVRGDSSKPCLTFQKACTIAQAGDVISVTAGTFSPQTVTCTPSSNITFQGASTTSVIIQFGDSIAGNFCTYSTLDIGTNNGHGDTCGLDINGASNLTFQNMTISDQWAVHGGASNIAIQNVNAQRMKGGQLTNLTVQGGSYGPYEEGANGNGGSHFYPENSAGTGENGLTITGVTFHDYTCNSACISAGQHPPDCLSFAGQGSTATTTAGSILLEKSQFINCGGYDAWAKNTWDTNKYWFSNITFRNNFFGENYYHQSSGAQGDPFEVGFFSDFAGQSISNVHVLYNTMDAPNDGNATGLAWCTSGCTFSGNSVIGNILPILYTVTGCQAGFTTQYNVVVTKNNACDSTNTASPLAMSELTKAGYPSENIHLSSGSAVAIDKGGTACAGLTDIDGDTRPQGATCDAGADEYMSPAGSANIFVAANGSDVGANCKRFTSVQVNPDISGTTVCASFNKAYQLALPGDLVAVAAGNYGNQFFNAHSPAMTPPGVIFNAVGGTVSVGQVDIGDDAGNFGSGRGTQHVDWVNFKGPVSANNTTNIRHTTNITLDGWSWNQGFASRKSIFLVGDTDKTTITHSDICCTQDDKIMESTVPAPNFGANSNLTISYTSIHSMRRSASTVHNECFLAPAVPGLTLISTKWYGCTVMNINIGAFGDSAPYSQSNFHWVNNVFESPTDLTETDKTGFPFFQGCNTPAPTTMPGWLVEYNIFETGWYDSCGGASGLTLRDNIGSIGNSCPSNVTYSKNIWKERTCNASDTLNANILFTPNFVGPASHDWHYTSGNPAIDKGDPANYPALDADAIARYSGAAPDAGAYEFTSGSPSGPSTGDLNSDGHVNILDLSIMLTHYGSPGTAAQGDCNNDGSVNILDLSILLSHYGT